MRYLYLIVIAGQVMARLQTIASPIAFSDITYTAPISTAPLVSFTFTTTTGSSADFGVQGFTAADSGTSTIPSFTTVCTDSSSVTTSTPQETTKSTLEAITSAEITTFSATATTPEVSTPSATQESITTPETTQGHTSPISSDIGETPIYTPTSSADTETTVSTSTLSVSSLPQSTTYHSTKVIWVTEYTVDVTHITSTVSVCTSSQESSKSNNQWVWSSSPLSESYTIWSNAAAIVSTHP